MLVLQWWFSNCRENYILWIGKKYGRREGGHMRQVGLTIMSFSHCGDNQGRREESCAIFCIKVPSMLSVVLTFRWCKRAYNKVITIYRILKQLTAIPSDLLIKTNSPSRTHSLSLQIPHTRTEIYKSSFFPSAIRYWNKLTENVVTADTLDSFKSGAQQLVLVK